MTSSEDWKYDVAISLLSEDEPVGERLADRLREAGWEVFFYPQRLLETAGSEGVEKFRSPFRDETRFSVVLFREGWGETDWTAVEAQAIKERQMEDRWRSFQVVRVGPGELPQWVPRDHIYVDFDKFGVEGAAAVIEEELRRGGAEASPESAADRAKRLQRARERRARERRLLNTDQGVELADQAVEDMMLFTRRQVKEIEESGVDIAVQESDRERHVWAINVTSYGLTLAWSKQYRNSLESSQLVIRELDDRARFRGWGGREPQELNVDYAYPRLDSNDAIVWEIDGGPDRLFTPVQVIDRYLSRLVDRHFDRGDDNGNTGRVTSFRV